MRRSARRCGFLGLAALVLVGGADMLRGGPANDPAADPGAVITAGHARFTVLTPQLIRMEWSADGVFEDHASLVFLNRRLPVPAFTARSEGAWLAIETEKLSLRYRKESGRFAKGALTVQLQVAGKPVVWDPTSKDTGNLRGTTRTLDEVKGATQLEPGLVSRDGWVLVDDTRRPLFDNSEWPWAMPRPPGERQDWYFFGYGHDYKSAMRDFTRVAGPIPMPPRFAFGTWWSRYWSYTDQEFRELVREFEIHDVPLDVLVIDMDWHLTFDLRWDDNRKDQSGHHLGWSGYTWNRILFPDPPGFLAWCEKRGLKTPLNLHPASGVQPHEEAYPEMARAMGIDPATKKYIPFDIVDKKFAQNYLQFLHYPLERQGIDFWWLDWQQEHKTRLAEVNPTWWLNYVHTSDMERRGRRPLIFHRWGGLGNHRYQIGFSGDTVSVWKSLAFQPYFTATAANVGYGYWSHDIGGHMPGKVSPELFARWIQFGAFSPILRTHTTKNPRAERRIWAYPVDQSLIMRDAFLLRYALIPYVYTAARQAYDTGLSICRPLYYDYPETPEAYQFKDQYLFGNDMLVAPIAGPVARRSKLAEKTLWLPDGTWIEWFTGARLRGPARLTRRFALDEIPVYVRAGAVIPMQPKMRHTGAAPVDPLILTVFSGASGSTRIYEDENDTLGYRENVASWTTVRHSMLDDRTWMIEVLPVEGRYPGMLEKRGYEVRLPGVWPPQEVSCNGQPVPYAAEEGSAPGWRYDGDRLTTIISLPRSPVSQHVELRVKMPLPTDIDSRLLDGVPSKLSRVRRGMARLNEKWPKGWSPDSIVAASQTGHRISLRPETAREELEKLERDWPSILRLIGDAR